MIRAADAADPTSDSKVSESLDDVKVASPDRAISLTEEGMVELPLSDAVDASSPLVGRAPAIDSRPARDELASLATFLSFRKGLLKLIGAFD